uniref:Uncharacterized protein n=1 Tax=Poecilia latipinna TaxID=48699 RepID=A0A3B3TWE8_9TELE
TQKISSSEIPKFFLFHNFSPVFFVLAWKSSILMLGDSCPASLFVLSFLSLPPSFRLIWNSLPVHLKSVTSFSTFKNQTKLWLCQKQNCIHF